MAINTGVNVSKLNAYGTLAPLRGVNVTKVNAYAVLAAPPTGVQVSKLNAYAVLVGQPPPAIPNERPRSLTLPLYLIVLPEINWE